MNEDIIFRKSTKEEKKYMVTIGRKTIHFGSAGMSDFTKHKTEDRKRLYILRHKVRENWKKSGIKTAGFWSRWILWNKPTLTGSIKDTEKRFNINIKKSRS
jgi:hypothetical protein